MISYLSPIQYAHTVIDFRNKALPIIDRLIKEDKIPIIVGGTNYYIEALLWNFLINKQDVDKAKTRASSDSDSDSDEKSRESSNLMASDDKEPISRNKGEEEIYTNIETSQLYKLLEEQDPESARKLHPHNRRKIIRALEVHRDYGVKMSVIHDAQHEGTGEDKRGALRYLDPCVIWIKSDINVLYERLDTRVDAMIEQGLLKELEDFHKQYKKLTLENKRKLDFELGIFQTIGFKEFHNYLILDDEDKQTKKGKQLLKEGIDDLKRVTRQYSRRQIRWINNRFLRKAGKNVPHVYRVDSTDVSQWDELVYKPAIHIVKSAIQGVKPDIEPEPYQDKDTTQYQYNTCHICDGKVFVVKFEWEAHLNSRKHKAMVAKRKRETMASHPLDKRYKKTEEVQS
ncbi:tRNA dimethylallyltransferase isoform X2 [Patella vulgata]|nr:tRNA dimethylallyltransferase isoform X2 [Patella vulgata]